MNEFIQSQSHIATDGQSVCLSWRRAPAGAHDQIILLVWKLLSCPCGAPFLTRGRVCRLSVMVGSIQSQSQSYVTTDGQSTSLSWNKAPIWGLRPDLCYCQTFAGLFMWGALSDERTGMSFTTFAGPRQRSHSQVRIQWHSLPYFTVSDSRLPFSSPPTTRRVTVEVFDPASTRV
jgi:hypothetical protein